MTPAVSTPPKADAVLFAAFGRGCRPRQRQTVSQWSDRHRRLSTKGSSEAGPWRTDRTPYLREIMDCLSVSSPVREVVLIKPAQIGGTEVGLNWIGYVVDQAPAPMLVVVPTLEVRKRWVRQRLGPMLTETPVLAKIYDAKRKRDAANAEDIKDFPGGLLVVGGANSPASLASMPIKNVLCDEVDRFPWEVGVEGDPLGLIRQRQATFTRRKLLLVSTPTIQGASRIEEEYERSDRRRYHVPCPHCGELLVLQWNNLRWSINAATREPMHVRYVCEHCGAEIEEHHKTDMLARGQWIPDNPGATARGYRLNGLYAPIGLGYRWIEIVRDWLSVQDDNAKLKRFVNTVFGEVWEDRSHDIKPHALMERAEPHALREIPKGCLLLTAGVDVQGDRLEVQVVGWGRGWQPYPGIDWLAIPGDPSRLEVWAALADYLRKSFTNRFGKSMPIAATGIDTGGHHTHEVYHFARTRGVLREGDAPLRRVMAMKGANVASKPILVSRASPQDVNWRGKVIRGGVLLWTVGTDTAKHTLFNLLTGDAGKDPASRRVHFSQGLPEDYYDQLTAEVFDPERNRWVKRRGRRNEALDTWVYAAAASQHPEIRAHAWRAADWKELADQLEPPDATPVDDDTPPPATPAPPDPPPKPARPRSRGGFVGRWK